MPDTPPSAKDLLCKSGMTESTRLSIEQPLASFNTSVRLGDTPPTHSPSTFAAYTSLAKPRLPANHCTRIPQHPQLSIQILLVTNPLPLHCLADAVSQAQSPTPHSSRPLAARDFRTALKFPFKPSENFNRTLSHLHSDFTNHTPLYSGCHLFEGVVVAEQLACLPPTKANRVQSPAGPLPDFHIYATGRRVFSGSSHFPRPFIPVLLHTHLNHPIGSQDLAVKSHPNLFIHSSGHLVELPLEFLRDEVLTPHAGSVHGMMPTGSESDEDGSTIAGRVEGKTGSVTLKLTLLQAKDGETKGEHSWKTGFRWVLTSSVTWFCMNGRDDPCTRRTGVRAQCMSRVTVVCLPRGAMRAKSIGREIRKSIQSKGIEWNEARSSSSPLLFMIQLERSVMKAERKIRSGKTTDMEGLATC
ncbi:hypothetical protein PR048_008572 [Dryococelus australis]|uniref:Uncharacterized protein n=1 Tax=Dryococelus australis TaxID=614101 RepID=A0ABQ9HXH2_9NEOP|nr:hypothetical protein PR048_008572 [Dryococelus australis]